MRRVVGAIGGTTGVLSTIFAAGWIGVVLILAVVLIVTGAVCWVLADDKRPARLTMLLRAYRANGSPKPLPPPRRGTPKVR